MNTTQTYEGFIPHIQSFINKSIPGERKTILQVLVDYIQQSIDNKGFVNLNFICTHNSRRSQFAQVWAQVAAAYYRIDATCFSGGVEVTAFNSRAIDSLLRTGFKIAANNNASNPKYSIYYHNDMAPAVCFSKEFDHHINPTTHFAAVMTCSHADENCPFIPGAEKRIPLLYDDPKAFDGTPEEAIKYDERSAQIASEMFYVFSKVNA